MFLPRTNFLIAIKNSRELRAIIACSRKLKASASQNPSRIDEIFDKRMVIYAATKNELPGRPGARMTAVNSGRPIRLRMTTNNSVGYSMYFLCYCLLSYYDTGTILLSSNMRGKGVFVNLGRPVQNQSGTPGMPFALATSPSTYIRSSHSCNRTRRTPPGNNRFLSPMPSSANGSIDCNPPWRRRWQKVDRSGRQAIAAQPMARSTPPAPRRKGWRATSISGSSEMADNCHQSGAR